MMGAYFYPFGYGWNNQSTNYSYLLFKGKVNINVPSDYIAVSNGELKEIVNEADGTLTYKWHTEFLKHLPFSLAAAKYKIRNLDIDGFSVNIYYYDVEHIDQLSEMIENTIKFYVNLVGPLHFPQISIVETSDTLRGIGDQTMILYPSWLFTYHPEEHGGFPPQATVEENIFFGILHEIGHQWWPGQIVIDFYTEAWLSEGINCYMNSLGLAYYYGEEVAMYFMNEWARQYFEATKRFGDNPIVTDRINLLTYTVITYFKGAWVNRSLESVIGSDTMKSLMYKIQTEYLFQKVNTKIFQSVAESLSSMNLEYFFEEWFYGSGVPDVNMKFNAVPISSNEVQVTLTTIQQESYNIKELKYYTMPSQFKLLDYSGKSAITWGRIEWKKTDQKLVFTFSNK